MKIEKTKVLARNDAWKPISAEPSN